MELIRARYRETTETLVASFADVLAVLDTNASDAELGRLVKQAIAPRGEVPELRAACEAVAAYSGDNYLPLLWSFYKSHRSTLFRLARTLCLASTNQDRAVLDALEVTLGNEQRHGDLLLATVDLSFASEQWQRAVLQAGAVEVDEERAGLQVPLLQPGAQHGDRLRGKAEQLAAFLALAQHCQRSRLQVESPRTVGTLIAAWYSSLVMRVLGPGSSARGGLRGRRPRATR